MSEKPKYPLRGVIVSLNTPFDERDRVDLASLERCVEYHIQQGAAGFIAGAQAGEVYTLKASERTAILQRAWATTGGRAKMFASATSRDNRERFAVAEQAVAMGYDGVLVEVPEELKGNRAGILEFFREYAKSGMKTLMIQDLSWSGPGMPVELIARLFEEIEPFCCLKVETVPAGPKCSAALERTGGRLHVSLGWASLQLLEALDRSVDAIMSTGMTGLFRRIFDAYASGEREQAKDLYRKLLPILAFTQQHLDISMQFYKRFFFDRGIFSTTKARAPGILYDRVHEEYARELIRYLEQLDGWTASE